MVLYLTEESWKHKCKEVLLGRNKKEIESLFISINVIQTPFKINKLIHLQECLTVFLCWFLKRRINLQTLLHNLTYHPCICTRSDVQMPLIWKDLCASVHYFTGFIISTHLHVNQRHCGRELSASRLGGQRLKVLNTFWRQLDEMMQVHKQRGQADLGADERRWCRQQLEQMDWALERVRDTKAKLQ